MASQNHIFNLRVWLARMALGSEIPDIVPALQPVQVVGDASLLVPPLLPPTGVCGGQIGAAVGEHGSFQLWSKAPGGTLIRRFVATSNASNLPAYYVQNTGLTFVGGSTSNPLIADIGPDAVSSVVTVGRVLPANRVSYFTCPGGFSIGRAPFALEDLLYIPPGFFFVYSENTVNQVANFDLVFQDLPAQQGE